MEKPTLEYDGNLGKERSTASGESVLPRETALYRTDKGRGWRTRVV